MTIAIGQKTEFALVQETTYGVTPGSGLQYYDAVSEALKVDNTNVVSNRLRGGRLPTASALVKPGRIRITGNIDLEVQAQSIGWFLKHTLGGYQAPTQTTAPYTHSFYVSDLPTGMSVLIKRDSIGTFTYTGCRINRSAFTIQEGMTLKCNVDFIGQNVSTSVSFGTASYPSNNDFFTYVEGNLALDGTTTDVHEVTITVDNQLKEMPKIGSRVTRQPVQGRAMITGTIKKEFEDLTVYNKFVGGNSASLVLQFVGVPVSGSGTRTLTMTFGAIFYTGGQPVVPSIDPIEQDIPWEARDDGTTATTSPGGISISLINDTATYA